MCQDCCQQPEKLKDRPESCTPEQIKECHGEDAEHPCAGGQDEDTRRGAGPA